MNLNPTQPQFSNKSNQHVNDPFTSLSPNQPEERLIQIQQELNASTVNRIQSESGDDANMQDTETSTLSRYLVLFRSF